MLFRSRYKLVHYYGTGRDETGLYDNEKDPLELRSFFGQPGYEGIQADLEQRLRRLRVEFKEPAVDDEYATGEKKRPGQGKNAGKKGKGAAKAPEAK